MGGDSLQLLQVFHHYQSLFNLDTEKIPSRVFFEHDTIDEHAKIIGSLMKDSVQLKQWHPLHIAGGEIYFVYLQERHSSVSF